MKKITRQPLIQIDEIEEIVCRSRATIWKWWAKDGVFPKPVKIRGKSIGWRQSDVDLWLLDPAAWSETK